ncbi:ATP-binding protein [Metabacillus sp. SLBN-84]
MKVYISEIISILQENIDFTDKGKAYLFRLDNFVHPQIYLQVCRYLKAVAYKDGLNFNAKLSKEQYFAFRKHQELIPFLTELDQEGLVEQDAQMTTWRNTVAEKKGILFLMGTESVQDKGGLADFYKISPEIIERRIGKKYANLFINLIDIENQYEKTAVNAFIEHLFRVVPKDLYKLSCIIDRLEDEKISGGDEVLGAIGRDFVNDWGLPCIDGFDSKTMANLGKGKKFDLIDKANKFKTRADFKDGLTKAKFNKLLKKIEEFKNNNEKLEEYTESVNRAKELFGSFDNFEKALIDYFKGKNLEILRPKLFQLDFKFINSIINFKTENSPKTSKDTIVKVYGSPMEALAKIIFNSLSMLKKITDNEDKPNLQFSIIEAVLSNYIEDNQYDLYNSWSKVCFATGGLIEYIQEELEDEVELSFKDNKDPFEISNADDLSIKPTKGTQTLSYIIISVAVKGIERQLEYKWVFNPNEYWLNTFDVNLLDELIDSSQNSLRFLPIFYSDSLGNLLSSVDADIFFHQLNGAEQKYINVFDLLPKELQEGQIASKLYQLSNTFLEFIIDLKNKGFYNTVNVRKSNTALRFVDKYTEIIRSLIKNSSSITTSEKKYVHLISNLFLILQSKDTTREKYLKGAIVPPLHPAMQEKMIEQHAFYRKGLKTLIDETHHYSLNKQFEKVIENITRQSTIISGLDNIISDISSSRLTKEVFGYYGLHGEILEETALETVTLLDGEIVFDEDFNTKEMLTNSFMSRLIEGKLTEYVQTFPAQSDCIKIGFLNFEHLQPVVSGVHAFIGKLKEISHPINIKLQIISPSHLQEGRTYVNYWLDNFFNEEDNVKIETYYRNVNIENGNYLVIEEVLLNHDMIFVKNVMSAGKIAYRNTGEANISPTEMRFPMVFHPLPVFDNDSLRRVSISQRQFQAAFMHSQLTHWIEYPDSKEGVYRVEKELYMSEQMRKTLEIIHSKARWVVTLDTALDKSFFDRNKVISFSTGEGPYGELNMTVSASNKVREDVVNRLTKRLKDLFPSWDRDKLNACSENCIEQSKDLDGIKILKALNPYDYEVHSFLSYILSFNSLSINSHDEEVILRAYIPMDSYMHWFLDASNRPDYLLVEIRKNSIKPDFIEINATIVECKMGKESNVHVEKGLTQITNSISYLSEIFNGSSISYNKRYWFAQLYRALVFAPNFVSNIEKDQIDFNKSLINILDGKFKVNWSGKLLTYWLDQKQEESSQESILIEQAGLTISHESFGQLYIQKHLLPREMSEDVKYEDIGKNLLSFANNRNDFETLVEEHEYELIDEQVIIDVIESDSEIIDRAFKPREENIIHSKEVNRFDDKKIEKEFPKIADASMVAENEEDFSDENKKNNYGTIPLEKVRVLLGKDARNQQNIYWEYGHQQLENRHILISGKSGVGKTYFIQCLLFELANNGISSIVFDYTDGFKKTKLEPEFNESLKDNIEQFLVFKNKFPINPFKRTLKELDENEYYPESDEDVADRIKSVFMAVYKDIGSQQANSLYQATKEGLRKYGDEMDLQHLGSELEALGTSYALTTLSKLQSIIDRNPFDTKSSYNWDKHLEKKGKVFIVQLTGFNRDVQLVITEFILWDLWNYLLSHGDKSRPFPAIIDEAQNLDHSEKSPSAKILTEGRKFGWSGWYATQFMQGQLSKDEIQRIQNASQKIYFSPPEEEINNIASYLDTDSYKRKEWAKKLAGLRKGQCVVWGPTLKSDGNLQRMAPRIVDVSPFSERMN